MLNHPTLDQLKSMKLTGMAQAFEEQLQRTDLNDLSFDDRLAFLVEREHAVRSNRQLTYRLRRAQLKLNATVEDIDHRAPRGLDKSTLNELARCRFINDHLNVLITGPTGVGKTYLACAIAHSACRNGFSARYLRVPRLLTNITIARGDGTYHKLLAQLAKTDLVILDDWGLAILNAEQRRDLLDILDDRHALHCDHRDIAITRQTMARGHRRSHARRCHPRPARAQRLHDQFKRRIHAEKTSELDSARSLGTINYTCVATLR